jgi:peptidoglycan/LPS O-acetylase OafA/YrhL
VPPQNKHFGGVVVEELKRFKALDGIRGIAAIVVAFFWHYKAFFETDKPFYSFGYWAYNYGWIMVDLFFILSGFVFFTVYDKMIQEHKMNVKDFIVLRFSRLYPLHFLTLCIVLFFKVVQKLFDNTIYMWNGYRYSILDLFINIPMLQNGWLTTRYSFNAPSWSVSIEIMMYLVFFYIFHNSGSTKKYLIHTFIMIYGGLVLYVSGWNTAFFNGQIARGLMGFFLGIITAEMYNYCKNNGKNKNIFLALCGIGILGTTVLPVIIGYNRIPLWVLITTFVLFPSLIIFAAYSKPFSKVLAIAPLRYFGDLSYSIYLWHYPVVLIVRNIDNYFNMALDYSNNLFFVGYFLIVIIISHISHYCFENPIQKYIRNKFIGKNSGHCA